MNHLAYWASVPSDRWTPVAERPETEGIGTGGIDHNELHMEPLASLCEPDLGPSRSPEDSVHVGGIVGVAC